MISMDSLLGMIWTEGVIGEVEDSCGVPLGPAEHSRKIPKLPPIRYDLELIELPDGSYEWVED